MKIAIQGERGSFSHAAANQMVAEATIVPCQTSAEVFSQLEHDHVAGAVIPIENTLAGSVAVHYDLLLHGNVFIQKEHHLRIVHNLIVSPGVHFKEIKRVFSHPVALDQCRHFLHENKKIQAVPFYDTAGSVKHVVEQELQDSAAIAGELAAQEYHGVIIKREIEDNKHNFTRFFLIKKTKNVVAHANKTSLVFGLKNLPGALFKALSIFATRELNLTKIESRPVHGEPWQYVFFIDVLCGQGKMLEHILIDLKEVTEFVKILGIYPSA